MLLNKCQMQLPEPEDTGHALRDARAGHERRLRDSLMKGITGD